MVEIGHHLNKDTRAVLTDMNQPLGKAVGNSLEVIEACETLKGRGPKDLEELCLGLGTIILQQAHVVDNKETGIKMLKEKINDGSAFIKLKQLVEYEGGDSTYLDNYNKFKQAKYSIPLYSNKKGYIHKIEALNVGECAMHLGAGRATKDDIIDMSAGILLNKKVGDYVDNDELLLTCYTDKENGDDIINELLNAFEIKDNPVHNQKIIYKVID